jgi:hypothetical protein
MLWAVVLAFLIVALFGWYPAGGPTYAPQWGYATPSLASIVVIVLIVLLLTGRL